MKNLYISTALSFLLLCGATGLRAQTVTIGGAVPKPYTLNPAGFQSMKQLTVMAKGHDGKMHRYTGVSLSRLLALTGLTADEAGKKQTVSRYIKITAQDEYKVVFAMAEIDTAFNKKTVILANKIDGKPLTITGPYQLIVPGEKKWGRWIRMVTGIEVGSVK